MPRTPVLESEEIKEEPQEEQGFRPGDGEDTAEAVERLMGMRNQFQDEQQAAQEEDQGKIDSQGSKLEDLRNAKDAAKDAKGLADKFGMGKEAAAGKAAGSGAGGGVAGAGGGATAGAAGTAGGTAAGTAAGAGAGAGGGAAAGAAAGTAGGPAAPVTVPVGAAIGAALPKLKKLPKKIFDETKKIVATLFVAAAAIFVGGCGCLGALILIPVIVIFIFLFPLIGGGHVPGADAAPGGSAVLTVSKTASPNVIAKGAVGATVTYTIVVTNSSTSDATGVALGDVFQSAPEPGFAGEITGYLANEDLGTIPAGGSVTRTFTVSIPHTDYDPGWLLGNQATVTGTIDGATESSSDSATVLIGDLPSGPPAYSPLSGGVYVSGYRFGTPVTYGAHQGTDIASSNYNVYSPFVQPAIVTYAGGVRHCPSASERAAGLTGYGLHVRIRSGTWEVLIAHLDSISVTVGQTVTLSTFIGVMDNTGCSGGDHVHYEIRNGGVLVDPEDYNAVNPHP
jgi:uncharacterized repeat protein (TIGR01451 family)